MRNAWVLEALCYNNVRIYAKMSSFIYVKCANINITLEHTHNMTPGAKPFCQLPNLELGTQCYLVTFLKSWKFPCANFFLPGAKPFCQVPNLALGTQFRYTESTPKSEIGLLWSWPNAFPSSKLFGRITGAPPLFLALAHQITWGHRVSNKGDAAPIGACVKIYKPEVNNWSASRFWQPANDARPGRYWRCTSLVYDLWWGELIVYRL